MLISCVFKYTVCCYVIISNKFGEKYRKTVNLYL